MVYDSTIAQVAASNPQAAYALANVPVGAPQAPQSQQPALQMAQAPQADTVNFSSGAAVAYPPQQEEKSLLTLKNFVLGATAFVLGRAGLKTNAVSNAFKELNVTKAGEAIAEGVKGTKVSDTHELSMLDTFLHYANPVNLFRNQAAPEGLKAFGDDAAGLLAKEDGSLVFKHEDGIHFNLKEKDGVKSPVTQAAPEAKVSPLRAQRLKALAEARANQAAPAPKAEELLGSNPANYHDGGLEGALAADEAVIPKITSSSPKAKPIVKSRATKIKEVKSSRAEARKPVESSAPAFTPITTETWVPYGVGRLKKEVVTEYAPGRFEVKKA